MRLDKYMYIYTRACKYICIYIYIHYKHNYIYIALCACVCVRKLYMCFICYNGNPREGAGAFAKLAKGNESLKNLQ